MMARDWGKNTNGSHLLGKLGGCCGCSYRRTTLFVCSINLFVALYVLRTLYASIYLYSCRDSAEVKQLEKRLYRDETVELLLPLKWKITDQILQQLKVLNASATIGEQREAVEPWRKETLREVEQLILGKLTSPSNILPEEAGLLKKAMGSSWAFLSEEIGLWIPMEVVNKEHDVEPDDEEETEEEVLPGRPLPPECHTELHTDYDGIAVRWGPTHHKESAADCCQACLDQAKYAKPSEKKCNIWVYCPSEAGCYSPDVYEHKNQECWLKYAEQPRLNFKDRYSETYRNAHPNAPMVVSWVSGVITQ